MSDKKWYAVYTRVRWEKKVSECLTKRRIENYCPLNKVQRQWADRKKIITEPLFKSYVFVRSTEQDLVEVLKVDGVINMVYWLGKPAVIRHEEIMSIRNFLNDYHYISLQKIDVNINDHVRVISGPLLEYEGQVIAVRTKTVKLSLPSLGYLMSAEVETSKIELIHSHSHTRMEVNRNINIS